MHSAQDLMSGHDFSEIRLDFADERARSSNERRISSAIVAPADRNQVARCGQLAGEAFGAKGAARVIGELRGP